MSNFLNPRFKLAREAEAAARYVSYKAFIDEFFDALGDDIEEVSFDDVRSYFAKHENEKLAALSADMTDGVLEDLCIRHGIELVND